MRRLFTIFLSLPFLHKILFSLSLSLTLTLFSLSFFHVRYSNKHTYSVVFAIKQFHIINFTDKSILKIIKKNQKFPYENLFLYSSNRLRCSSIKGSWTDWLVSLSIYLHGLNPLSFLRFRKITPMLEKDKKKKTFIYLSIYLFMLWRLFHHILLEMLASTLFKTTINILLLIDGILTFVYIYVYIYIYIYIYIYVCVCVCLCVCVWRCISTDDMVWYIYSYKSL